MKKIKRLNWVDKLSLFFLLMLMGVIAHGFGLLRYVFFVAGFSSFIFLMGYLWYRVRMTSPKGGEGEGV